MSKRKLLSVQKDAEELFNILFSEQNTTAIAEEIEDAEELQIVFQPPNDGADSDKDDAPSDNEEACANFKDIGRGILSQSAEIKIINKDRKEIWILNLKHLKIYLVVPKNEAKNKRQFENGYLSN